MKRIVNGKRYDTDTANLLASWGNSYDHGNFHWCEEDLYKTPRGNYFLHGKGGSLSMYAEPDGNGWCGGSTIEPMTREMASKWAEERGQTDLFDTEFADDVEDA